MADSWIQFGWRFPAGFAEHLRQAHEAEMARRRAKKLPEPPLVTFVQEMIVKGIQAHEARLRRPEPAPQAPKDPPGQKRRGSRLTKAARSG